MNRVINPTVIALTLIGAFADVYLNAAENTSEKNSASDIKEEAYNTFPVGFLNDMVHVQDYERINNLNMSERAKQLSKEGLKKFIAKHSDDFKNIETSIGKICLDMPEGSRSSLLESIEDYCRFVKELSPEEQKAAFKFQYDLR